MVRVLASLCIKYPRSKNCLTRLLGIAWDAAVAHHDADVLENPWMDACQSLSRFTEYPVLHTQIAE